MKSTHLRSIEIACLTILAIINLLGICWGPPPPPFESPAGNMEMSALTVLGMAAYGFWKMRK